jgi:imidazolonepropionase-like amidohydrolase
MGKFGAAALAFVSLLLTGPAAALAQPAETAAPPTAYAGAQYLDVVAGRWRWGTILVRGERIEALPGDGAALPAGTVVVDMRGHYAIPGLIDVHLHISISPSPAAMQRELSRAVHGGVTAVRDMAGDARILAFLARAARLGEIPAPDIYFAALVAGPSFFTDGRMADEALGATPGAVPWMRAVTAETDLAELVAAMRGTGASGMKVYANLRPELVRALIAEAHRQNFPIWAHGAIFPTTPLDAVEAGADTISHVCMLAYQTQTPPPASYDYADRPALDEARLMAEAPTPEMAALYAAMRERGTLLDTTLWVYRTIERLRAEMTAAAAPNPPPFLPPIYCSSRLAEHLAGQAARAGVALAAGTDSPGLAADSWPGLFEELVLLRDQSRVAPIEVLRAATVNAARALGQSGEMGVIAPGRLANIAFLTADPLASGANLRTVALTVKRGRQYWRRDFDPRPPPAP